jgi:hypothetical protein
MANNDWDDFDEDTADGQGSPKALREAYDRQKKELNKLRKEYEGLNRKVKQSSTKDILESLGVNPKVARFVLADVEDVSKETVAEWVNENGELFGISLDGSKDEPAQAEPPKGMSPDEANALAQLNQFSVPDANGVSSTEADLEKRIKGATSPDELVAMLGLNSTKAF